MADPRYAAAPNGPTDPVTTDTLAMAAAIAQATPSPFYEGSTGVAADTGMAHDLNTTDDPPG